MRLQCQRLRLVSLQHRAYQNAAGRSIFSQVVEFSMSTCRQLWRALALVATLSLVTHAAALEGVGRLATYEKAPGEAFFALSIMPKVAADPAQTNEVVILFDTSASQAGTYRDEALAALGYAAAWPGCQRPRAVDGGRYESGAYDGGLCRRRQPRLASRPAQARAARAAGRDRYGPGPLHRRGQLRH